MVEQATFLSQILEFEIMVINMLIGIPAQRSSIMINDVKAGGEGSCSRFVDKLFADDGV